MNRLLLTLIFCVLTVACATKASVSGRYRIDDGSGLTVILYPDGLALSCLNQACERGTYKVTYRSSKIGRIEINNRILSRYFYDQNSLKYGNFAPKPNPIRANTVEFNFEIGPLGGVTINFDAGSEVDLIRQSF